MAVSQDQNVRRSHNIKIDNSSFKTTEKSKYMGTTLTYQNSIQEEMKGRLKSRNTCYHSMQNRLSSSLLSKNIKIKIHGTLFFPVVLFGYEALSLTLREERWLRYSRTGC